ncbi:MAG: glycosyltransferase family 87 protein [Burkholderiales bacterium]
MSGRAAAAWFGAALVLALSFGHFVFSARAVLRKGFADFPSFMARAVDFLHTGRLYVSADNVAAYAPGAAVYKFPPFYALFLLPFAHADLRRVETGHWALQIALYLLTVMLTVVALRPRQPLRFAIVATIVALNFAPFFETLYGLQVETELLLLVAVALLALLRGHEVLAGVALGVAGMLKLYPIFLLLYLGLARRWRAVAGFLAAAAAALAVSLAVFGPAQNRLYFTRILPVMLQEQPDPSTENVAFGRYAQTLLGATPAVAKRVGQLLAVPLVMVSAIVVYRGRRLRTVEERVPLELALFVALMLLCLANSWTHYQLLLLIPILVLLAHAWARPRDRASVLAATLPCWGLLLLSDNTPRVEGFYPLPPRLHAALLDAKLVSTVLAWGALLALLLRRPGEISDDRAVPPIARRDRSGSPRS